MATESWGVMLVNGCQCGIAHGAAGPRATMRDFRLDFAFAIGCNVLGIALPAGVVESAFGVLLSPIDAALRSEAWRLPLRRQPRLIYKKRRFAMKKFLAAMLAGAVLALPLAAFGAPDAAQKAMIERAQEAKKKLAAAQAASGAERQKMMQEHMKMMQEMMAQMRKAKPREGMSSQQMREWVDEHMKLMDQMMGQVMDEHHMMMQGQDMPGMGMGKK